MTAAYPEPQADGGHAAAVARSLGWAEQAAERADWADALGWIAVVEACGDELPDEFRAKRDRWELALRERSPPAERAERPDEAAAG